MQSRERELDNGGIHIYCIDGRLPFFRIDTNTLWRCSMNKTPFEQDLDTLDLTFAQVQLIKQMVAKHIIGEDETVNEIHPSHFIHDSTCSGYLIRCGRDELRNLERERLGQL